MTRSRLFLGGVFLTGVSAALLIAARLFLDPETASKNLHTVVDAAFGASQVGLLLMIVSAARHVRKGFAVTTKNRSTNRLIGRNEDA